MKDIFYPSYDWFKLYFKLYFSYIFGCMGWMGWIFVFYSSLILYILKLYVLVLYTLVLSAFLRAGGDSIGWFGWYIWEFCAFWAGGEGDEFKGSIIILLAIFLFIEVGVSVESIWTLLLWASIECDVFGLLFPDGIWY